MTHAVVRICPLLFTGGTPLPLGRAAKPFAFFPAETRLKFAIAVASPTPPAKWLTSSYAKTLSRAWYEWHWARGIDPDRKRRQLDPFLRHRVIERDGYVCQLCGGAVKPVDVHIDHIFPRSKGGADAYDNLQVTHSLCNLRKGAL